MRPVMSPGASLCWAVLSELWVTSADLDILQHFNYVLADQYNCFQDSSEKQPTQVDLISALQLLVQQQSGPILTGDKLKTSTSFVVWGDAFPDL